MMIFFSIFILTNFQINVVNEVTVIEVLHSEMFQSTKKLPQGLSGRFFQRPLRIPFKTIV